MDALGKGEGWKAGNGVRDAGQVKRSMTTSIRLQITIDHYHVLCCGFDPSVLSMSDSNSLHVYNLAAIGTYACAIKIHSLLKVCKIDHLILSDPISKSDDMIIYIDYNNKSNSSAMVATGGPYNSISFMYLTPAFITNISQGITKATRIDDRAESENGSSGYEPPQFSSRDLLSVRFSSRHSFVES